MGHKVGDKVTHPIPQSAALFGIGLQVKMFPGSEITWGLPMKACVGTWFSGLAKKKVSDT